MLAYSCPRAARACALAPPDGGPCTPHRPCRRSSAAQRPSASAPPQTTRSTARTSLRLGASSRSSRASTSFVTRPAVNSLCTVVNMFSGDRELLLLLYVWKFVECRINTNTRTYSHPGGRPRGEGLAPPLRKFDRRRYCSGHSKRQPSLPIPPYPPPGLWGGMWTHTPIPWRP